MYNDRCALLQILDRTPVEDQPWMVDLTWWRDAQIRAGDLPERYLGNDGFLALHEDLLATPYYVYAIDEPQETAGVAGEISVHQIGGVGEAYNGVFQLAFDGVNIETYVESNVVITRYVTAIGTLEQRKRFLPESSCYAFTEYPVKTRDDLDVLSRIIDGYRFTTTRDAFLKLSDLWGDRGIPIAPLPRSPLSALIVDWMGVENFIYAWQDYPDQIRKLLLKIDQANDLAFDIVVSAEPVLYHFCDNLSASTYAPYYAELAEEYYCKRIVQLHEHGKRCAVHLDGTITGLLGPLARTGFDAVEALTTEPIGDVPVEGLRDEAGVERVILWGAFPAAIFTPQFPKGEFDRYTDTVLEYMAKDRFTLAGTADQISPNADIERVRLVGERLRSM